MLGIILFILLVWIATRPTNETWEDRMLDERNYEEMKKKGLIP